MTAQQPPAEPDARVQRLLGGAALAPLRQRLRRAIERRIDGAKGQSLLLTQLSATEHEALALLTGRPAGTARSARIDIERLDAALRAAGVAGSLREVLERIDGPIISRTDVNAAMQAAWSAVSAGAGHDARLQGWLQTPGATTLLKRLTRQEVVAADHLLAGADAVLRRLPGAGMTRSQLAAEVLGNAHALDAGQPTASVVLAAWRYSEVLATPETGVAKAPTGADGSEAGPLDDADPQRAPETRDRDVWARAGVLVNELARPALVLNLPALGRSGSLWTAGEPAYLSLRLLLRAQPQWSVRDKPVFVCENPNLLAIAADRLGAHCAPMVCTEGMPAAAQRTLLTQLAQAGARLHYHGDFDWPGIHIANHVLRTWQARPWRLATVNYEAAANDAPHSRCDLADNGPDASWDKLLAPAMRRHGLAIAEEAVAGALMEDLERIRTIAR
jgi:uncharacterized protein (TIGR02679 family)